MDYIKSNGGDAWKVHGHAMQRRGEPDIDAWLPVPEGIVHLKLEVKTPKGKATPLQLHRIAVYQQAGYVAGVVVAVEDLIQLVERARERGLYVKTM